MFLLNQNIIELVLLIPKDLEVIHIVFMILLPSLFIITFKNEMIQEIEDKIVF